MAGRRSPGAGLCGPACRGHPATCPCSSALRARPCRGPETSPRWWRPPTMRRCRQQGWAARVEGPKRACQAPYLPPPVPAASLFLEQKRITCSALRAVRKVPSTTAPKRRRRDEKSMSPVTKGGGESPGSMSRTADQARHGRRVPARCAVHGHHSAAAADADARHRRQSGGGPSEWGGGEQLRG